ncbi:MAG: hypothetical protein ACTHJW_03480 [Streptosporangiaceae bacterium]
MSEELGPRAGAGGRRIEFGNEFTRVVVELVRTRNGARLRISVPASGREISLCPLEIESLTWQEPEFFSRLLATPFGPESGADQDAGES